MTTTKILNFRDQNYPYLLKQIHKPPQKLYYKGNIKLLQKTCIAVVGTRKNSDYGEEMTRKIIDELSHLDICIVSGLAIGIDTVAHQAALEYGLSTIAILGSGIDNIYPLENIELADTISQKGLIMSEYEGQLAPLKGNFPQRNRIVSGISVATIIIEAPEKSGALITAKLALEQNREIFALPGDIDRLNSIGPLRLLQNGGAYPISSGQDVIDILRKPPLFKATTTQNSIKTSSIFKQHNSANIVSLETISGDFLKLSPDQQELFELIPDKRGLNIEQISQKSSLPINELLANLSILEIKNLITTKDGKYCRKC